MMLYRDTKYAHIKTPYTEYALSRYELPPRTKRISGATEDNPKVNNRKKTATVLPAC